MAGQCPQRLCDVSGVEPDVEVSCKRLSWEPEVELEALSRFLEAVEEVPCHGSHLWTRQCVYGVFVVSGHVL